MVSVLHVTSKMREAYEGVRMSFLELDRLTVNERLPDPRGAGLYRRLSFTDANGRRTWEQDRRPVGAGQTKERMADYRTGSEVLERKHRCPLMTSTIAFSIFSPSLNKSSLVYNHRPP